jgi:hypothetical protein
MIQEEEAGAGLQVSSFKFQVSSVSSFRFSIHHFPFSIFHFVIESIDNFCLR